MQQLIEKLKDESIYTAIQKEKVINHEILRKYYGDLAIDIFEKGSSPKNRTKALTREETTIYLLMCGNCKAISDIAKPTKY